MNIFICQVCGHLEFGEAPANCPACGAEQKNFVQNDNIFKESQEKSPEAEVKHIPSVQVNKQCGLIPDEGCTDVIIRIGATLHPMEEKHFIQFIDCYLNDIYIGRSVLTPKMFPAACFHLKDNSGKVTIVENCNIHGYWKTDVEL